MNICNFDQTLRAVIFLWSDLKSCWPLFKFNLMGFDKLCCHGNQTEPSDWSEFQYISILMKIIIEWYRDTVT